MAEQFILAVKREKRAQVPEDWQGRIGSIEGIESQPAFSPWRLQVTASSEGIAQIQKDLGPYLHIERPIPHEK